MLVPRLLLQSRPSESPEDRPNAASSELREGDHQGQR